ncbi:Uncharacterised protein [uncultured Clostridium sp.]|nr:Uncharacterised protein [uncultured Clostridium sp.]
MKNTNIYKISDIQKVYKCSYSEAFKARQLLFFISDNGIELEEILNKDDQEDLLQFCIKYARKEKVTQQN